MENRKTYLQRNSTTRERSCELTGTVSLKPWLLPGSTACTGRASEEGQAMGEPVGAACRCCCKSGQGSLRGNSHHSHRSSPWCGETVLAHRSEDITCVQPGEKPPASPDELVNKTADHCSSHCTNRQKQEKPDKLS